MEKPGNQSIKTSLLVPYRKMGLKIFGAYIPFCALLAAGGVAGILDMGINSAILISIKPQCLLKGDTPESITG